MHSALLPSFAGTVAHLDNYRHYFFSFPEFHILLVLGLFFLLIAMYLIVRFYASMQAKFHPPTRRAIHVLDRVVGVYASICASNAAPLSASCFS